MRKIDNLLLIVGVILIVAAIGFIGVNKLTAKSEPTPLVSPTPTTIQEMAKTPDFSEWIKNSEIIIPDTNTKVKLVNGNATVSGENQAYVTYVSMVGMTQTSVNNYDVYASYAVNYGGSGQFLHVGLFNATSSGVLYTSSTPALGDRIIVSSATASAQMTPNYNLTVSYLDRTPTQSMADRPTVPASAVFQVKDHVIVK